jgi:hypothetical protein
MTNPRRPCFGCEVFDDHPRHEIVGAAGEPLPGDPTNGPMHMDCCAALRGCVVCARAREGLTPDVIGEAFREHVVSLPPLAVEHVPNDDDRDPHNLTTARLIELEG